MILHYKEAIQEIDRVGSTGTPFLFVLDYEKNQGAVIANPLEQEEVLFKIGNVTNIHRPANVAQLNNQSITKHPISIEEYATRFEIVQKGMKNGQSVLINLTVPTPIETPLSLQEILYATSAQYQILLPEAGFVCFSPERFVHISEEGKISTDPMKGTITSDTPGAPDIILNDYKETSEHCAVVDLLKSDLSKVASEVSVSRFRYFTEIQSPEHTIYQVSSEIVGQLPSDWKSHIGTIIDQLLPAGSILGAPRESTRQLIAEAEGKDQRGFYCGIFGYFNGKQMDSSVLIRFIKEEENGQKIYHSGGGVTTNSRMDQEYKEVINKIYLPTK